MSYPDLVCTDFETVEILNDGSTVGSTEAYRKNFRVSSAAFSYYDEQRNITSKFVIGESAVRIELQKLAESKTRLICHNIQFEMMVSACRFPGVELNWYCDTMRLVQNYDNGGDKYAFEYVTTDEILDEGEERKKESIAGLGLVKSLKRIFGDKYESHKSEAHEWISRNVEGVKRGREGRFLDKLPADLLERYNIADTENTLRLYTYLTREFDQLKYDWTFDHTLYLSSVRHIVAAKIRGVRVDREQLMENIVTLRQEIAQIETDFLREFSEPIKKVEASRLRLYYMVPKSPRGRQKRLIRALHSRDAWASHIQFNSGSNKQLEALFVATLGITPKFFTAKGSPSFKSSMLSQWGKGGEMLKKRRKRMIVLSQCESLMELSNYDGRWHSDLRAAGTATGRYVGSK